MKILITLTVEEVDGWEQSLSRASRTTSFVRQLVRDALGEFRNARGHEASPTAHGDGVETYVATRYAEHSSAFRVIKVQEVRERIAIVTEMLRHDPLVEWTSR